MSLEKILANVQLAVKLAKLAFDLGKDAAPYIKTSYDIVVNKKVLTPEEHKSMSDQEALWRAEIDAQIAADDKATD